MRKEDFAPGERYHVFNRGTGKIDIFGDDDDRRRLLWCMNKYLYDRSGVQTVSIAAFVLMSNHFHLALQERRAGGISYYLQKVTQSYAMYFNLRYNRPGCLFSGRFKARHVDSDVYWLHLTRYIHRNPSTIVGSDGLESYPWSSYPVYLGIQHSSLIGDRMAIEMFSSPTEYKQFVDLWRPGEDEMIEKILVD